MLQVNATTQELKAYGVFIEPHEANMAQSIIPSNEVLKNFTNKKYLGDRIVFFKTQRWEGREVKDIFFFLPEKLTKIKLD